MLDLTQAEKHKIADILNASVEAGETYESFVNAVSSYLWRPPFAVADSMREPWNFAVARRDRIKAELLQLQSKKVVGGALYDALVALGWTPPHA